MAKRRGSGEGTITQREDGRWMARIDLGTVNGRRKRLSIYGKTRKEVADKLVTEQRKVQQGLPVAIERQTVEQFLNNWLADVIVGAVRPRTYHSYAQIVRIHLIPALGKHQLTKLAPQNVQALMNARRAQGLSPRTVLYIRAVLRRALGQALKWGLVAQNVATLVDPPKPVRHEPNFLTGEQARRFLAANEGDRLEALYAVAVALGLRQAEILGLRWQDVDFEAGTLAVRRQLQRLNGRLQLVDLKTRQSHRTVAVPASVMEKLRAHRARQAAERAALGPYWRGSSDEYVFTSTVGTPLEPRNVVRSFKAVLANAGLPDMRFHDLRHTCASLLLAQGVSAREIMETLGHSQITMTLNTYTHIAPDARRRVADAMDSALGGEEAGQP
jgi:integrase